MENQYSRVVGRAGAIPRLSQLIWSAFEVCDRQWRGIGSDSRRAGLRLRWELRELDAERRFDVGATGGPRAGRAASAARSFAGSRSRTTARPSAQRARPSDSLGATMVSAEGACAAYYAYGRRRGMPWERCEGRHLFARRARARRSRSKFFRAEADRIEALVRVMADRFTGGGRLVLHGQRRKRHRRAARGASEFCHPIIEKRRPLPALALDDRPGAGSRPSPTTATSPRCSPISSGSWAKPGDMALDASARVVTRLTSCRRSRRPASSSS